MKVKAEKKGHDGKSIIKRGQVFDWPGEQCPAWCTPVGGQAVPETQGQQDKEGDKGSPPVPDAEKRAALLAEAVLLGVAVKENWTTSVLTIQVGKARNTLRKEAEGKGLVIAKDATAADILAAIKAASPGGSSGSAEQGSGEGSTPGTDGQ